MTRRWITLLVSARNREAEGVLSFELVDPDGKQLPPFSAGSHIDVETAPGLVRQYSLCNPPHERRRYQIGVLREPASRGGSASLHDRVQPGDCIRVSEPHNHFALAPDAKRSLLLAGGIGVTPILCMAERLKHIDAPFEFHYATRSRNRAAFIDRAKACNGHIYFDDEPQINRLDLEQLLTLPDPDTHVYVCGPSGFIGAVLTTTARLGWPDVQVHREFFAAAEEIEKAPSDVFEIQIASTGKVLMVPPDASVTDILVSHGIDIPVSCQQGVCGTCITRLLDGVPDHRDTFMTAAEHARNDRFTPCCSRAITSSLVLDL